MPRITPVTERLRDTCIEAIDALKLSGKASSVKSAALMIYNKSRSRHAPTGFTLEKFERFYWSVVKWCRKARG